MQWHLAIRRVHRHAAGVRVAVDRSAGREGERFDAVVIDEGLLQLRDPAVRGRLTGPSPALGSEVSVRLDRADPVARTVAFSVWSAG